MPEYSNTAELLSLLQCVECKSTALNIVPVDKSIWYGSLFNSSEHAVRCDECKTLYPITDDNIPIMWTDQLRDMLLPIPSRNNHSRSKPKGNEELFSNISNYDIISDDYAKNWRKDIGLASRIQSGVKKLLKQEWCHQSDARTRYHLDIGCGPGHVIEWLEAYGYKQIGLDVSLANLRNTRKITNALVVLGDATDIPIKPDMIDLVTGSAVLHHIFDWELAVRECCRVCDRQTGGILFDSEPTIDSLDLSILARLIFEMRWPVYRLISYFDASKKHFKDTKFAKNYYKTSEVHNQPGRGINPEAIKRIFHSLDFKVEVYLSPGNTLLKREKIDVNELSWKRALLHALSGHNPLLSKYGTFSALATSANPHPRGDTNREHFPEDHC